jgi:DNA-binding NtrC family response regulator
MRDHHSVLCIADEHTDTGAVTASIRLAGCDPLTMNDWNQGIAQYFVNRQIEAVVLDYRGQEGVGICLAKALRSIRADVPILLITTKKIDPAPKGIDLCVCAAEASEELSSVLQGLLRTTGCAASA